MTKLPLMNARYRPYSFSHPLKQKLAYLLSVERDLVRAKEALELLLGSPPLFGESGVIASSLYTQALVSYFRCFPAGTRKGLSRALYSERPDLLERHDDMRSIRDQHITHSVSEFECWDILVAAKDESSPAIGFGIQSQPPVSASPNKLQGFFALVNYAHTQVKKSITSIGNQLAKEVVGGKATWKSARRAFDKHLTAEDVDGPTDIEA
ncbi:MAG: hypothetical protein M0P95_08945 [Sulfuritalea sp.]|nr:hypothetical protein [Sulfuritalea sp.]